MGIRIIEGTEAGTDKPCAVLCCSVDGCAFGPVFDSADDAEDFLAFVAERPGAAAASDASPHNADLRSMARNYLVMHHAAWLAHRHEERGAA